MTFSLNKSTPLRETPLRNWGNEERPVNKVYRVAIESQEKVVTGNNNKAKR